MTHEDNDQFTQNIEGSPGIQPEDPIAEAARKIFLYQYQTIRFFEDGVRIDQDIEALHKMRVAVRRMRTAYRVIRDYIEKDVIRPTIKELRGLGDALGAVRDLDVFLLNTEIYRSRLRVDERKTFIPIIDIFEKKRQHHRIELLALLDSQKYRDLCEGISEMLARPHGLDKDLFDGSTSYQTDVIAREIIRRRYEKIRAFDRLTEKETIERLHKIRIAVKVFRYSIEFFEEILGSKARNVIETLISIQDHLGELNDGAVAVALIENLLSQSHFSDENKSQAVLLARNYLEFLRKDVRRRIDGFPSVWEHLHQVEFKSFVDELISM